MDTHTLMQHFNPASPSLSRMSRHKSSSGSGGWLVLGLVGALILANQDGTSGKIAYISQTESGNYEIFVADPDFNTTTQITDGDYPKAEPDWSPDGMRLLFTSWGDEGDDEVFMIDADGSNEINVSQASFANDGGGRFMPLCPDWLDPCEHWVTLHSDALGDYNISAINLDTGEGTELITETSEDLYAQWSPDGTKLVYMSDRANGSWDIFVLDLLTGETLQYTDTPNLEDVLPVWSPDGKTIAWTSGDFFNFRIWLMDAECSTVCGTNQRILLPQFDANAEIFIEEWDAAFSPDSQWIVFTSNRDLSLTGELFPLQSDYEIFRVRVGGDDLTQLTDNEVHDFQPDWFAPPKD
jgi:Tol biopolymer transport system component